MKANYHLAAIGLGPFHLSLAALLAPLKRVTAKFLEQKKEFRWHQELLLPDAVMQTSFLKDLVTPVDPTNPYSFLNYLVKHGRFYAHLNTGRTQITRKEFETYCQWVSCELEDSIQFNNAVEQVEFSQGLFHLTTAHETYRSQHLSVATGAVPWVPEFAKAHLGATCFHAKSVELLQVNMRGKRVVVIGGGQTGLEIFRNSFKGLCGQPLSTTLISHRHTLEPLDESPFTNEYFTPDYAHQFYGLAQDNKERIVAHQRMASDGNTPFYLQDLYNELYQRKFVEQYQEQINLLPQRRVFALEKMADWYQLSVQNEFSQVIEKIEADIVIFATGFKTQIPDCLVGIGHLIDKDEQGRWLIDENFALKWKHGKSNYIYALNFGRHIHGIAEPQTSLMAWRAAVIINHLCGEQIYSGINSVTNFTRHNHLGEFDQPHSFGQQTQSVTQIDLTSFH